MPDCKKKTLMIEPNICAVSSWQQWSALLCSCGWKIARVRIACHSASLLVSRFFHLDFYLFNKLKKWLAERRDYSKKEVLAKTNANFAELGKSLYSEGISRLEQLWMKCMSLKGDHVEKLKTFRLEKSGNFYFRTDFRTYSRT